MSEIKNAVAENQSCPVVGYQSASVCVPVRVVPYAKAGGTITSCCGDPVVLPGSTPCAGNKKGECSFTITQTLCIAVPVEFGADAYAGDAYVDCLGATAEECAGCGD